jgi:hypothetical protein
MIKYLWHILIQGHSWNILKIDGGSLDLYVLLQCQKCRRIKTIKSGWTHDKFSWDPETSQVGVDDLLNKIKGK